MSQVPQCMTIKILIFDDHAILRAGLFAPLPAVSDIELTVRRLTVQSRRR